MVNIPTGVVPFAVIRLRPSVLQASVRKAF